MKSVLFALALLTLQTDNFAPAIRFDLDIVRISVDLSRSWASQGGDRGNRNGRAEFAFEYFVDMDISNPSHYRFDELLALRV